MSDLISVSSIRDTITECPVCKDQYDESAYIPRRMPCCVQSVCNRCLCKIYKQERQYLRCPLCRQKNHLPEGVQSLPKERVILNVLDHLKIQKRIRLTCTDCPDNNPAKAQCDDCLIFMCSSCRKAHVRNVVTKQHRITSLEEMQGRPIESFRRRHQCIEHKQDLQFYCKSCDKIICGFCTVVDHKPGKEHNVVKTEEVHRERKVRIEDTLVKLDIRKETLRMRLASLQTKAKILKTSVKKAKNETNELFEDIIEQIVCRKTELLSDIEKRSEGEIKLLETAQENTKTLLAKVKSSAEYTRHIRSKSDHIEDLQLMTSYTPTLDSILNEKLEMEESDKKEVTLVQTSVQELASCIRKVGHVRTDTSRSTGMPCDVTETNL